MNPLDRITQALAVKSAPLTGAQLNPQRNSGSYGLDGSMFGSGPMAFPGWPDRALDGAPSPERRKQMAMISPWYYSDVSAIAGESGALELQVEERTSPDDDQAELSPVSNHPLEKIWTKPNPFMGHGFVLKFWVWQMYLTGKGYLYFAPDRMGGDLLEMWPVPSSKMKPIGTADAFIDHYEYTISQTQKVIIPAEYICYSRFVNPFDLLDGLAPLNAAFAGIEADLAMSHSNLNFFDKENAIPTAIASLSDSTSDPDFFRIRQDLLENFGRGKRKLLVTRGSDIDFKILAFSPEQMMFDKLREISRVEIDRACGLPDGFWTSRANRANSEHADSVIINTIIWPLGTGLVEDLNVQIVDRHYGDQFVASFKDIRARNVQQEIEQQKLRATYYTVGELRQLDPAPEVNETGYINGDPNDPRNTMLLTEIKPGQPALAAPQSILPQQSTTPASKSVDESPEAATARALTQWQSKAIKRLKAGKSAACQFESDVIPASEQATIRSALGACKSADDVRRVFTDTTVKPVTAADVMSAIKEATKLLEAAQ